MKKIMNFKCAIVLLFMAFGLGASSQSLKNEMMDRLGPVKQLKAYSEKDYWVWCGSVIKGDDGCYHMFASRWPKRLPFHPGWLIASEIVHVTSDTPDGPYEFKDVALPARGAQYWDGRSTHNPRIMKYKDTYVLFYMGSTHPFKEFPYDQELNLQSEYTIVGRSNKRIGIAYSKSLSGPWTRLDKPILETKPNTHYSYLTSNPAPWINEDGSVLLVFKAREYKGDSNTYSDMSINVASAPNFMGPYTVLNKEPIFSLEKNAEVEDPCIWKNKDGYHLLAKDQRGKVTGNPGHGLLAHSKDGLNWVLDDKPYAYSRTLRTESGEEITLGQMERCAVLLDENNDITHLFFATMNGPSGFENSTESWNVCVPLRKKTK